MSPAILDVLNNALAGGPMRTATTTTTIPWGLPVKTPATPENPPSEPNNVVHVPRPPVDALPDGVVMPDHGFGEPPFVLPPKVEPVVEAAPRPIFAVLPPCADICNDFDTMWNTCAANANHWMCGEVCSGAGENGYAACRSCSAEQGATTGELGAIDSAFKTLSKGCAERPHIGPGTSTSSDPTATNVPAGGWVVAVPATTTTTAAEEEATPTETAPSTSTTTTTTSSKTSSTTKKATSTKATATPTPSQTPSFARARTVPMGLLVAAAGLVLAL